jgi:hypothetical protein
MSLCKTYDGIRWKYFVCKNHIHLQKLDKQSNFFFSNQHNCLYSHALYVPSRICRPWASWLLLVSGQAPIAWRGSASNYEPARKVQRLQKETLGSEGNTWYIQSSATKLDNQSKRHTHCACLFWSLFPQEQSYVKS